MHPRFSYAGLSLSLFMIGWVQAGGQKSALHGITRGDNSYAASLWILALLIAIQMAVAMVYMRFWRITRLVQLILAFLLLCGILGAYAMRAFEFGGKVVPIGIYILSQGVVLSVSSSRRIADDL
jgi:hypothetical protein